MFKKSSRITALFITTLVLSATTAEATQFLISGNLGQSFLFDKSDGASGQMDVDGEVSGASFLDLGGTTLFGINNGANLTLSGSDLSSDTSAAGRAIGSFGAGGTLSITGTLTSFFSPVVNPGDLILEGTISAFSMDEDENAPNFVDSVGAVFTPTGGWLFDNGHVVNPYSFELSIIGASQDGGDVEDFATDIMFTQSSTWVLVEIPEPSTLVLFGALGVGLLVRRK